MPRKIIEKKSKESKRVFFYTFSLFFEIFGKIEKKESNLPGIINRVPVGTRSAWWGQLLEIYDQCDCVWWGHLLEVYDQYDCVWGGRLLEIDDQYDCVVGDACWKFMTNTIAFGQGAL